MTEVGVIGFCIGLYIIFHIVARLIFWLKGKPLGCTSSIVALFLSFIITTYSYNKLFPDNYEEPEVSLSDKKNSTPITDKNGKDKILFLNSEQKTSNENFNERKSSRNVSDDYKKQRNLQRYTESSNPNSFREYKQQEKIRIGAVCNDGTYSNATGRGACSHHGGVAYWVYE
ncbi:DUF3761 domain-containing protein [Aequorivita sediminis]|uniref:DUF3761 domain-containing protein n=1 Tax=Aequorivita sediminis TaxID=3073653 RepID=UPI0028B1C1DE|nr:DUF3761 domain-containing protein [Aequorivita sp. F6058]